MKQKVQGFRPSLRFGLAAVVSLAVTFSGAMVGAADANADEAIIDDTASTSQAEVAKQEVPSPQPKSTVESASSQSNTVAESSSPQQHEVEMSPSKRRLLLFLPLLGLRKTSQNVPQSNLRNGK